jgi:homocysteine S-methyltransferase
MLEELLAESGIVLAECAIAERLRRMPGVELHPTLFNAPLLYGPESSRRAMAGIYREYLEIARAAGRPMLLTAPTWRLDAERLAAAGMPPSMVVDAVAFLRKLRHEASPDQPPVLIGGLVGPRSDCYRPDLAPGTAEAEGFHCWQVGQLVEGGADFLLAQTMPSVAEAAGIARVMSCAGKPWIISFCTGPDGCVLDGTPLPEAMARIDAAVPAGKRPVGYFVNCTHPRFLLSAYEPSGLGRLIGIQANGSSRDVRQLDGSAATEAESIASWTGAMAEFHRSFGVSVLGGCCGTGADHLAALADLEPALSRPWLGVGQTVQSPR